MKDGAYYIYKATAGSRRLLLNSTDSIAIFDRTEMNITIIPKVDGVVHYCNINCTGWIDPNISESYQYATSHELTTAETSTQSSTPSTSSMIDSTGYLSSLLMYVSTLVTSYTLSSYSSSIYRTSSPEIFITIWSSQEIRKLSLNPLHITGQLVIPNQTRLRLDVSDIDISAGESIVLFTFSSRQGSFDELELIGYSECLGVSAHLEESETQITLVFTTTSAVCRATLKQIM
jgi:acetoacetate decarboxylase